MRKWVRAFIVLSTGLITSCAATKPIFEQIKPPTTAVVLLDMKGSLTWSSANTSDPNKNFYVFKYIRVKYKGLGMHKLKNHVFAIPVTVGSTFKIRQLSHLSKFTSVSIKPKWDGIKIDRKGIYYYGYIETHQIANEVSVKFTPKLQKSFKKRAQSKYPRIFKKVATHEFLTSKRLDPMMC